MPHLGTHITIVQRLALSDPALAAALGSPDPVVHPNLGEAGLAAVRKMRFASLGAVGPDLFYFLADYSETWQDFQTALVKLAGTVEAFENVGEEAGKIEALLGEAEDLLSCGSSVVQSITGDAGIGGTVKLLLGTLMSFLKDMPIEAGLNPWSGFELRRQKDEARTRWFWADYLHYVKTGDFAGKLLEKCRFDPKYKDHPNLFAYALGYLTHYVADTVGHPYVNQIVQAPYRHYWQRHALVENFIDAWVWDRWHVNPAGNGPDDDQAAKDPMTAKKPLDQVVPAANALGKGASLHYARLHKLVDCGEQGFDPVDAFFAKAAAAVTEPLGQLGLPALADLDPTDDAELALWTELMAEAIAEVYGGAAHPENLGKGPDGLPKPDEIAAAYGICRFFLKLMSDESVREPTFPDVKGDFVKELKQLWNDLEADLDALPSPPTLDTGGGFDLEAFWRELKAWAHWVAEAAAALAKAAIDLIKNFCGKDGLVGTVGRDLVKIAFFAVQKALWAVFQALRKVLVLAGLGQPTPEEVADLPSLWVTPGNMAAGAYPVEEYFHEGELPQAELWTDYTPLTVPATQPGAVVELPSLHWIAPHGAGANPGAFLDGPLGPDSLFTPVGKDGGGPPQVPTAVKPDPDMAPFHSFADEELDYGGALANCSLIIHEILAHAGADGTVLPNHRLLPNFNLDGDRGYGWPCWDVEAGVELRPNHLPPPHQAKVEALPWED
jgi:hypothetical protein